VGSNALLGGDEATAKARGSEVIANDVLELASIGRRAGRASMPRP
jgi:hypothetical protein